MSRPDDADGFFSRWSRRKQSVIKGDAPLEDASPSANPLLSSDAPADAALAPDGELPLPSLDDVLPGGDVSAFLQKHVPDSLRNLALRKAWESDPVISTFIEMADYQLNYADPDSIAGWSSSVEGVDVKKFVDALFKNMPDSEEKEAAASDDEVENGPETGLISQSENDEFIITNTENVENAAFSQPIDRLEPPETFENLNAASQNNPDNSGGYPRQKRRHGSALPS
jgi:hypothetical protein